MRVIAGPLTRTLRFHVGHFRHLEKEMRDQYVDCKKWRIWLSRLKIFARIHNKIGGFRVFD